MNNLDIVLIITAVVGAIVLFVLSYRHYSSLLKLDQLADKPKKRRLSRKYRRRYMDGDIPVDNTSFGVSDVTGYDAGTDSPGITGGGDFGGAGATGGWDDSGGASDR